MPFRKRTHEEIIEAKPSVEDVKKMDRMPIYVVLDNIRSMHNVGAMFRTAEACMVKKIFLCGMTAQPPRKEISKTALGADEIVPWEYANSAAEVAKQLKKEGVKVIGLELAEGSHKYTDYKFTSPCALVIGHEINGIYDETFAELDDVVEIPMMGRANSLNVATAFGVLLYEVIRQFND